MDQQKLQQFAIQLQDELNQAVAGFKLKGWEHFKKVLGVAAALAFLGYAGLYKTTASQIVVVKKKVVMLREISKYAVEYHDLKAKFSGLKDRFPGEADRKDWLFNLVLSTAKEEGIAIDSITSQKEEARPDAPFVKLSIDVAGKGTYSQVGRWLARMEGTGRFTQIESFSLTRARGSDKPNTPPNRMNMVAITLTTVIPVGAANL